MSKGRFRAKREDASPADPGRWMASPGRLHMPVARSNIDPPVETRPQLLPFESLAWENFERLCLRVASEYGAVDHCADHVSDDPAAGPRSVREARLYGVRGQDQQGIDLYVRLGAREEPGPHARRYLCLQSRRVADVTARHLQKAASDFLAGNWAPVSRVFVYATSLSAVRRDLADEVRTLVVLLEREGIEFQVWDAEQLSLWLKDRPPLVDDFFGRVWAEAFCGEEAVSRYRSRPELVVPVSLAGEMVSGTSAATAWTAVGVVRGVVGCLTGERICGKSKFGDPGLREHRGCLMPGQRRYSAG